jgi:hypothetical protein
MDAYGFSLVIAGLAGLLLAITLLFGEVPGGRTRRTVRRDREPRLYWINVGCLGLVVLVAGAVALIGLYR